MNLLREIEQYIAIRLCIAGIVACVLIAAWLAFT